MSGGGRLDGVDLILHAGDVCTVDVLEELSTWAPVRTVLGNYDSEDVAAWSAPEALEFDLAGSAGGVDLRQRPGHRTSGPDAAPIR